jgi:hypothetical protein
MPQALEERLVEMVEQHFGVELRKLKDPATGREYVEMAQVCEILGLDLDEQRAELLADPVVGEGLVTVETEAPRPEPMEPADLQAHKIGICNPDTC